MDWAKWRSGHARATLNRVVGLQARPNRRRLLGHALRWVVGIGAAAIALQAVFGRRYELSGALATLENLRGSWVAAALVAELASIVAYAALQSRLLTSGGADIGMVPLTTITLAANAVQNSLPVGPAWSTVYAYRQFRHRGADAVLAGWTLVISSLIAFATLSCVALAGLVVSQGQAAELDLRWVIVVVIAAATALVVGVRTGIAARHTRILAVWLVRLSQRVVRRPRGQAADLVGKGMDRLRSVHLTWRTLAWAVAWSLSNWALDLSCLVLAYAAVRTQVPWRGLLLAYGAGQLAANLPVTLGGLGVVEGSLTVALVFYGGAEASTVAAVLLYRILSFWLLLPMGWSAALWLRLRGPQAEDIEGAPA